MCHVEQAAASCTLQTIEFSQALIPDHGDPNPTQNYAEMPTENPAGALIGHQRRDARYIHNIFYAGPAR